MNEDNRERVIYKITNKVNGKFYIGVSVNYIQRWAAHKNEPPTKMKDDIEKYGWNNFTFSTIWEEIIGADAGFAMEIMTIATLKPEYNSTSGGEGFPAFYGEGHPNCIYTDANIEEMRERYIAGDSRKNIRNDFGISKSYLGKILVGEKRITAPGNIKKKSSNIGEENSQSKLTNTEILDVRNRCKNGEKVSEILLDYDISRTAMDKILIGKNRKDAGGPIRKKSTGKGEDHGCSKFTNEEVISIRNRVKDKEKPIYKIAEEYGVNRNTISRIVSGKTYNKVKGPKKGEDY